jgi:hypothetical protein
MAAVGGTVPRGLVNVQVQKEGQLQLGLYYNFAPKSMFFGTWPDTFVHCDVARGWSCGALDRTIVPASRIIGKFPQSGARPGQVTGNPVF